MDTNLIARAKELHRILGITQRPHTVYVQTCGDRDAGYNDWLKVYVKELERKNRDMEKEKFLDSLYNASITQRTSVADS